jgi:pyruvate dehydrogenase kinase 2/3/4
MKDMQSVKEVKQLYIQSFLELLEFDKRIVSADQEQAFSRLVEGIYERHSRVLVQMARGAYEFRHHIHTKSTARNSSNKSPKERFAKMETTHAFLDRFYLCRIGIRVLIGQYLALRQPPVDHYVGIICSVTSPYEIVKRAIDDAAFMCTRKYGDAPEVIMSGRLDLTFPYVPTHLHYIMLELLKNSMRATVEWHGPDADFPPIKVIIADGSDNEDVVIKVSDEGGGIPRSNVKKIWSYLFTTADPSIQEGKFDRFPATKPLVVCIIVDLYCSLALFLLCVRSNRHGGCCRERSRGSRDRFTVGWFGIRIADFAKLLSLFWWRFEHHEHGGVWNGRFCIPREIGKHKGTRTNLMKSDSTELWYPKFQHEKTMYQMDGVPSCSPDPILYNPYQRYALGSQKGIRWSSLLRGNDNQSTLSAQ